MDRGIVTETRTEREPRISKKMVIVNGIQGVEMTEGVATRTRTMSEGIESQGIAKIRRMIPVNVAVTAVMDGMTRNRGRTDIARPPETIARIDHVRSALRCHIAPVHLAATANLPENRLLDTHTQNNSTIQSFDKLLNTARNY
jgi:hypothetical protein